MSELRQKMANALQLAGMSERTQQCYLREVRLLAKFHAKPPDQFTEEELEAYLLHRKNVDKLAPASMRICYAGIKFFYQKVVVREWPILDLIRGEHERKLPVVLSVEQVHRIIESTQTFHNRVYFATVYSCGLRLHEGLNLQVGDIHTDRAMLHVHRGKGATDRMVPLPNRTLLLLRAYWKTHRNPTWLFPARGRDGKQAPQAEHPMKKSTVQGVLRRVLKQLGIDYQSVSIHTLRHCYATHLLEAGVNVRHIQQYMGHSFLETTMRYFHLTRKGQEDSYHIIDEAMRRVGT
jgi:site-specific recombinase XerD